MDATGGYQCNFVDSVPEDYYCKKCSLVARKLTVTSCCEEYFCNACITAVKQQNKSCPECGEESFSVLELVKRQKRIANLQVYCNLKDRGCDWLGPLEQLDAHLDPDQDNCQYMDTKCPLDCNMAIPKNKVEQHVTKECVKRDFTCQHCNLKATYEEVVGTHLAECSYVPLQCPNMCGVTCEREIMEDHMKICRLEEVMCEFGAMGCEEKFRREDYEDHVRKNGQRHLSLVAASMTRMDQQLKTQLDDQVLKFEQATLKYEHKLQERLQHEQELKLKVEQQEKMLQEQQQKIQEQDQKLQRQREKQMQEVRDLKQNVEDCKKKLEVQEQKLKDQERKFQNHEKTYQNQIRIFEEQQKQLEKLCGGLKQQQDEFCQGVKNLLETSNKHEKALLSVKETFMTRKFSIHYKENSKDKKNDASQKCYLSHKSSTASHFSSSNSSEYSKLDRQRTTPEYSTLYPEYPKRDNQNSTSSQCSIVYSDYPKPKRKSTSPLYSTVATSSEYSMLDRYASHWCSPSMYAYPGGYKFRIDFDNKTYGINGLLVSLQGLSGDYDEELQWPTKVSFTVELINWKGGENWKVSQMIDWKKNVKQVLTYPGAPAGDVFIETSKLDGYIHDGYLDFKVTSVIM